MVDLTVVRGLLKRKFPNPRNGKFLYIIYHPITIFLNLTPSISYVRYLGTRSSRYDQENSPWYQLYCKSIWKTASARYYYCPDWNCKCLWTKLFINSSIIKLNTIVFFDTTVEYGHQTTGRKFHCSGQRRWVCEAKAGGWLCLQVK